jgi:hypothetical protein
MQVLSKKWLYINNELAYRKTITYTNKASIINLEEYLDKFRQIEKEGDTNTLFTNVK